MGEAGEKTVAYGRPRLLTHAEIIDGALELGLEGLTMKSLAHHLNVGTATLYQYWDSRKELMRAAAVHSLGMLSLPEDTGQPWSEYAYEYAICIQDFLAASPSMVLTNHAREYGYQVQFELAEKFLTVMERHGFSAQSGIRIFNIVGSAAFAGAVEQVRQDDFEAQNETAQQVAERQFGRLEPEKFPLLSQAMEEFTKTPHERTRMVLRAAFQGVAQEMGMDSGDILSGG